MNLRDCDCVFNLRLLILVEVVNMIKLVSGSSYVKLSRSPREMDEAINEVVASSKSSHYSLKIFLCKSFWLVCFSFLMHVRHEITMVFILLLF